jgi:hypothetical protein
MIPPSDSGENQFFRAIKKLRFGGFSKRTKSYSPTSESTENAAKVLTALVTKWGCSPYHEKDIA